jgi:hypothetical protein
VHEVLRAAECSFFFSGVERSVEVESEILLRRNHSLNKDPHHSDENPLLVRKVEEYIRSSLIRSNSSSITQHSFATCLNQIVDPSSQNSLPQPHITSNPHSQIAPNHLYWCISLQKLSLASSSKQMSKRPSRPNPKSPKQSDPFYPIAALWRTGMVAIGVGQDDKARLCAVIGSRSLRLRCCGQGW